MFVLIKIFKSLFRVKRVFILGGFRLDFLLRKVARKPFLKLFFFLFYTLSILEDILLILHNLSSTLN